jgi:hypothetical protein
VQSKLTGFIIVTRPRHAPPAQLVKIWYAPNTSLVAKRRPLPTALLSVPWSQRTMKEQY